MLLSCARLLGGAVWHFERKKKTENTALLAEHLQQVRHRNYNYTIYPAVNTTYSRLDSVIIIVASELL